MTTEESPGTPNPERGSAEPRPERADADDIRDAADTIDHSRLGAQLPHLDAHDPDGRDADPYPGVDRAPAGRLDEDATVGNDVAEADEETAGDQRPDRGAW